MYWNSCNWKCVNWSKLFLSYELMMEGTNFTDIWQLWVNEVASLKFLNFLLFPISSHSSFDFFMISSLKCPRIKFSFKNLLNFERCNGSNKIVDLLLCLFISLEKANRLYLTKFLRHQKKSGVMSVRCDVTKNENINISSFHHIWFQFQIDLLIKLFVSSWIFNSSDVLIFVACTDNYWFSNLISYYYPDFFSSKMSWLLYLCSICIACYSLFYYCCYCCTKHLFIYDVILTELIYKMI